MIRSLWILTVLLFGLAIAGAACNRNSVPTSAGPEQVRDRAVEWIRSADTEAVGPDYRWVYKDHGENVYIEPQGQPDWFPFDPMFLEGDELTFAGSSVNGTVTEWVHASVARINEIYEEAGPETGWLRTRLALTALVAARSRDPLNMLAHLRPSGAVETDGDTTIVQGTVDRAQLAGTDLPSAALERWEATEAARPGGTRDLVLSVSTGDGAPLSLEIGYPQPGEPIVEVYEWRPAGAHPSAPEGAVELEEWPPAQGAASP